MSSSSTRYNQIPYYNNQMENFNYQQSLQNQSDDSFFSGQNLSFYGSNFETPTPNSDNYGQNNLFNQDMLNYEKKNLSNAQYLQACNQLQTLPGLNNNEPQFQEQILCQSSNFYQIQQPLSDVYIKSDQSQVKGQVDDYSEHQKDSDQSTDAQIQSQQDNFEIQKEKVKTGNEEEYLSKLINQLQNGADIPEFQISQLNDEQRAIFYSMKSQHQSQEENLTPDPQVLQFGKEEVYQQDKISQDLLDLDMEIEQQKSQLSTSQLQSELQVSSDISKENLYQNLPNQKVIAQKKPNNQNSFKSNKAVSNSINQKNKKKQKRVEEMQKMIFKKSFKYVETSYFRERIKKSRISSKDKDNLKFYEDYFGQTAKESKIPLKNFFHPQKQIKKGSKTKEDTPGQKSFNQAYISLILKSENFRQKIKYYIDNLILEQIQQERISKTKKVIANLKKKYKLIEEDLKKNKSFGGEKISLTPQSEYSYYWEKNEELQSDELKAQISTEKFKTIVKQLEDYIQTNSKIKLPWTDSQIKQAIQLAQHTIIQAEE